MLHDQMRSVEPFVIDGGEEEESGLSKLEQLVVLVHVADTANERGFDRVKCPRASMVTESEA